MSNSEDSSLAPSEGEKGEPLIESAAKEVDTENQAEIADQNPGISEEIDQNRYERDGFVVSDDEASADSDSEEEITRTKRKRKRLKRRTPMLDEDDIQLIKDNLNEGSGEQFTSETKRFRSDYEGDMSVDSDGMDEFIVDNNENFSSNKRRDNFPKTITAEMEFAEEQNKEFLELFGYNKAEYETYELKESQELISSSIEEKLKSTFDYSELAKNYLLDEDIAISKLDVPERIQIKERNLGVTRDMYSRGEFFLRFHLSTIQTKDDLLLSVKKQREKQALWIFKQLQLLPGSKFTEKSDFAEVSTALIFILLKMQVNCYEPAYLFMYFPREIGSFDLDDLFEIQEQAFNYLLLVQSRDKLLKLADRVIPPDVQDENDVVIINHIKISQEEVESHLDDLQYRDKLIKSELKTANENLMTKFFPKNLVHVSEDLNLPSNSRVASLNRVLESDLCNYSLYDLENLYKAIIYEFGHAAHSDSEIEVKVATEKAKVGDDENSLFGDDSDDENKETILQQKSVKRGVIKRRSVSHKSLKSIEFDAFLKLIAHLPFVEHQIVALEGAEESQGVVSINVDKDTVMNPYKLCAYLLLMDRKNIFRKNLQGLYESAFSVLSRHFMLSSRFLGFLRKVYRDFGSVTTKPGSKYSLLIPDFANEFVPLACIDRKPFQELIKAENSGEFLMILKGKREKMLELTFNVGTDLLPHLNEKLERMIFSDTGYAFVMDRDKEELDYSPDILEEEGFIWDAIRCRFISFLLYKVVKPWIVKEMTRELTEISRRNVCQEIHNSAVRTFFRQSLRLPYLELQSLASDYVPGSLNLPPHSPDLRVLSLIFSSARYNFEELKVKNYERFDVGAAVVVSGDGNVLSKYDLPSLNEMDKLKMRVKDIIAKEGPHFVLFNADHGARSKHFFTTLEEWSTDGTENAKAKLNADKNCPHNPYKFFVPLIPDTTVSGIWAQTEYVRIKNGKYAEKSAPINELKALSMALFMLDPVGEVSKLYLDISRQDIQQSKMMHCGLCSLSLHKQQAQIPVKDLIETFEKVFKKYVALNSIDVSSLLQPNSSSSVLLQFVPGFGPRKAYRLIGQIERMDTTISSRLQLKTLLTQNVVDPKTVDSLLDTLDSFPLGQADLHGVMTKLELGFFYEKCEEPGSVYENSIGFLYFSQDATSQTEMESSYSFNPLDQTRIHPKFYKLASLLCWMVTFEGKAMPKFAEARLNLTLQMDETVHFEEDHDPTKTDKSSASILDRDDILFPSKIIEVIQRVLDSSSAEIDSIQDIQNSCFLEEKSDSCFKAILNGEWVYSNMKDIFESLSGGEDGIRFALEKKLEELANDAFVNKDLLEIVKVSSSTTNDFTNLIPVLSIVQELRFPLLPIKGLLPVDSKQVLFKKLLGVDMKNIGPGSLVSANVKEFTFRGIQLRFENGFRSFVAVNNIPSKHGIFQDYSQRISKEEQLEEHCNRELGIYLNDVINVWISRIDAEAFSLDCTLVEKDALSLIEFKDEYKDIRILEDLYFDLKQDVADDKDKNKGRRVIHPDFFNLSPEEFSKKIEGLKPGEFFFKPSSKGFLFVSLYWKVAGNRLNNLVVEELGKSENNPELAKRLRINRREFEDLDDIVANYISPINSFLSEVINYTKHYRDVGLSEAERLCETEKRKKRDLIPYFIIPDTKIATFFHFVFQPNRTVHKVSFAVKPEGFCLDKNDMFKSLQDLLKHLKGIISKTLKANQRRAAGHKNDSRRYDNYSGNYRQYSNSRYDRGRLSYSSSSYRR